jgi:hypothetical protein
MNRDSMLFPYQEFIKAISTILSEEKNIDCGINLPIGLNSQLRFQLRFSIKDNFLHGGDYAISTDITLKSDSSISTIYIKCFKFDKIALRWDNFSTKVMSWDVLFDNYTEHFLMTLRTVGIKIDIDKVNNVIRNSKFGL